MTEEHLVDVGRLAGDDNGYYAEDGSTANRKQEVSRSRSGHIGNLTRIYNEIQNFMHANGNWEDISRRIQDLSVAWRNFVHVHEEYFALLENEDEKEKARTTYEEQMERKLKFESALNSWTETRTHVDKGDAGSVKSSASSGSRRSGSSRLSTISQKRENLAIAQLKLKQLQMKQRLEQEEQEMKRKRQLMEAEMEAERAAVSLKMYQQTEKEERAISGKDSKPETFSVAPTTGQAHEFASRPLNPLATGFVPGLTTPQYSGGEDVLKVLRQVVTTPKIEYFTFDGDPLKYVTFIHNFETFLEKDNLDDSRRLQLLIQHCRGKAREAVESCANLPEREGYRVAKKTLRENFGKPHVIAEAHIKKLVDLPKLKVADGPSLMEFGRNLDIANRTLAGMGTDYVTDLDHMNTLRELAKKLPMFLRAKWTERAGAILESNSRPKFADFVDFVKGRAKLVDNEFGRDMNHTLPKERDKKDKGKPSVAIFTTSLGPSQNTRRGTAGEISPSDRTCPLCSSRHAIWRCRRFKNLSHAEKWKFVQRNSLCNKCLGEGHIAKACPRSSFRCQSPGCGGEHHTLMHRPARTGSDSTSHHHQESFDDQRCVPQHETTAADSTGAGDNAQMARTTPVPDGVAVAATGAGESRVCLGVIPVKVQGKEGNVTVETYALLDNGSEVTLCHDRLAKELNLDGDKLSFTLTGMTGSTEVESRSVDILVKSMDERTTVELLNVRTVQRMPISKSCIPKNGDLDGWPHLKGIKLPELKDGEVMLLIGLKEKPRLFLPLECRAGGDGEPVAVRYCLGWTVMGPLGGQKEDQSCVVNFVRTESNAKNQDGLLDSQCTTKMSNWSVNGDNHPKSRGILPSLEEDGSHSQMENEILQRQLERLWKTDFNDLVVETKVAASVEDAKALKIMNETLQRVNGHFQVALPFRHDPPCLPNNRPMAERRLQLLKKRLLKNGDLFEKYQDTMRDYIEKGHAQKVPEEELEVKNRPLWYLPHHPVTHPLKPGKVRVVFDCAAKYRGTSLNQQLLQGPDLANQLVGVLIRFRQESVALVADIEAMFHQVAVEPRDRDALRFLWWPNGNLNDQPEEYRMTKHLFGATSSPSCANLCLQKTASVNQTGSDPETVRTVQRNMYVDDLMKSVDGTDPAIKLAKQLRALLASGGFRLTKWLSNDRKVLAEIPESERAKSVVNLDIENLPTEGALGLKWNVSTDKFVWETLEKTLALVREKSTTRRAILSIVSSLFDPLGFIAPYVMKAKLLLQTLCRKKLGWDSNIPEEDELQWLRWCEDLPKLKEIQVDRCFKPKHFSEVKDVQLHIFSDGSRVGYGATAYLRQVDANGDIHCSFVIGKARLAPIREITIPRLELTAAVVSVKLGQLIREELDMKVDQVIYWTDSTSVLKCIYSETKRFHTFESNRLTIIRNGSTAAQWRHVTSKDNPADDASKGLKLDEMMKSNRWLNGPDFLWKEEDWWPPMIEVPPLKDGDPEVRKEAKIYTVALNVKPLDVWIERHSCWWKLKRAIAWMLRLKELLRNRAHSRTKMTATKDKQVEVIPKRNEEIVTVGGLTVSEIRKAEVEIIRHVQLDAFPDAIQIVEERECGSSERSTKGSLKKAGTSIYKLNPMLKDGVLVVGGRLTNAPVDDEQKHPMILPYKHHVTNLVIKQHHADLGHMGQESVLSSLRKRFWVVKGRSAVRSVIKKCLDCQKRKAPLGEQFMADLPQERVTPNKPPFTYVGVDYFGPLEVKQGRSRVKRYGCLFTCLTMRAVHIEVAHTLNTDSMINALRRFTSLRGCPEEIRSDCGTNFMKADKDLRKAISEWNQEKIQAFCTQRGIDWIFNPPGASHMGGVWERMIRSVRQILKALLKEQIVVDEVLTTVMAETTHILNSRPLTRNSDDPSDSEPLTPNHVLQLRTPSCLPPGIFNKDDMTCRRQWRQAQYLSDLFWRRWTQEYLPLLQARQKWNQTTKNLQQGDLVLLADEKLPRGQWPMARILEVHPSQDGLVRSVKVKTTTSVLKRPVSKLCRLEMDI